MNLPRWVPYFNLVARPLLRLGVPMGPDVLLTVRGRKSGVSRTAPVAISDYGGRRGFISPFAEAKGARNLWAAGTGTIRIGGRTEEIRAVELNHDEAVRFIKEVIPPIAATNKFGDWFVRNIDKIDIDHPEEAVSGKAGVRGLSGFGWSLADPLAGLDETLSGSVLRVERL